MCQKCLAFVERRDLSKILKYHAHIYFDSKSRPSASLLRERLKEKALLLVGPLSDALLGPHPEPMFEIHFEPGRARPLLEFLCEARGPHRVLVHEVTGDDPRDHREGAHWLGEPLELDESKLDPSPERSTP